MRFIQSIHHLCLLGTVKDVADLTGLPWTTVQRIDQAYLEAHLPEPAWETVTALCIDEVAYRKRHKYFTILSSSPDGQILAIIKGRAYRPIARVLKRVPKRYRRKVRWGSTDLWKAYLTSIRRYFSQAEGIADTLHLMRHLNHSLAAIRRGEQRWLAAEGKRTLHNKRGLLLKGQECLSETQQQHLRVLMEENQWLYQAYLLKE